MKKLMYILFSSSLTVLAACGGGGSSDNGSSGESVATSNNQAVTKSFTVGLSRVNVSRVSNGDAVPVDTAGVSNTGTVTIN